MRYITRMDYEKSGDGWYVRVPGTPRKFFRDGAHGGKAKALQNAQAHRDSQLQMSSQGNRKKPRSRYVKSSTAVVGVFPFCRLRPDGELEEGFRANWRIETNGKQRTKSRSFSARRHGWTGAWRLAVIARYEGIGLAAPNRLPRPPPRKGRK